MYSPVDGAFFERCCPFQTRFRPIHLDLGADIYTFQMNLNIFCLFILFNNKINTNNYTSCFRMSLKTEKSDVFWLCVWINTRENWNVVHFTNKVWFTKCVLCFLVVYTSIYSITSSILFIFIHNLVYHPIYNGECLYSLSVQWKHIVYKSMFLFLLVMFILIWSKKSFCNHDTTTTSKWKH